MLDDPLRGSGMEENGCITTVPEWRELGHGCERRWSLPSSTCRAWEEEREPEKTHEVHETDTYHTSSTLHVLLNNND